VARNNGSVKLFWRSKGSKAAPEGSSLRVHYWWLERTMFRRRQEGICG